MKSIRENNAKTVVYFGVRPNQTQHLQELSRAVLQALEENRLQGREIRPADSLSIQGEDERNLVRALVQRYRALSEEQRQQAPALLNALGKLQVATGNFEQARQDFQQVASLVRQPQARAEARYNTYLAALEQRNYPAALDALRSAVQNDPERFCPFPFQKYDPETILGAGGFGVAFRCRHRQTGGLVVVKSLRLEGLQRQVRDVFNEARALEELDHPAIIRIRDCDFADASASRPFLVMEYFEGPSLADQIRQKGPLTPEELLDLAIPIAEGLQAAHGRQILHRDIKPGNLLVRKEVDRWRVKIIDFGLALTGELVRASASTAGSSAKTTLGQSIAGTLEYASPEQMGRLDRVAVGPSSDIYSFGKTCCQALFQSTQPLPRHFRSLPPVLAQLLEDCLEEAPEKRPSHFGVVLKSLRRAQEELYPTLQLAQETPLAVLPIVPEEDSPTPVAQIRKPGLARKSSSQSPLGVMGGRKSLSQAPVDSVSAPKTVQVRLLFPGYQFFLLMYNKVDLLLDGVTIGEGSVLQGFDITTATSPGAHSLELRAFLRSFRYLLNFPTSGSYQALFYFDPLWGAFSSRVDVQYLGQTRD